MKALSKKRKGGLAGAISGRVSKDLEREGAIGGDHVRSRDALQAGRVWITGDGFDELHDSGKTDGPQDSVYFIRMGTTEAVKVGMAKSLLNRLPVLQCGSPVELRPVAYINFIDSQWMSVAERVAHHFAGIHCSQRFMGEWFGLTDKAIRAIAADVFDDMGWAVRGVVLPSGRLKDSDISTERRAIWAENTKIDTERTYIPVESNVGVCVLDEHGRPNARARALGYVNNEGQVQ